MVTIEQHLKVPQLDPNYFVKYEDRLNLDRLGKMSKNHPVNILVTGHQGCGKSSLIRQFAGFYKRPLATFQIGLLAESGQLFGQQRLKDGDTFYQSFLFPEAIQVPGCVIHLEEINRSETPHALNELFSVLSEDRSIWIDELGLVEVASDVVFFASMNEGEGFTGTDEMDIALRDRFYRIKLDYLPASVEQEILTLKTGVDNETAGLIVNVVHKLRKDSETDINISIRHSLMIGELMAFGATLREALVYSCQISPAVLESILLSVHVETGAKDITPDAYEPYMPE